MTKTEELYNPTKFIEKINYQEIQEGEVRLESCQTKIWFLLRQNHCAKRQLYVNY